MAHPPKLKVPGKPNKPLLGSGSSIGTSTPSGSSSPGITKPSSVPTSPQGTLGQSISVGPRTGMAHPPKLKVAGNGPAKAAGKPNKPPRAPKSRTLQSTLPQSSTGTPRLPKPSSGQLIPARPGSPKPHEPNENGVKPREPSPMPPGGKPNRPQRSGHAKPPTPQSMLPQSSNGKPRLLNPSSGQERPGKPGRLTPPNDGSEKPAGSPKPDGPAGMEKVGLSPAQLTAPQSMVGVHSDSRRPAAGVCS